MSIKIFPIFSHPSTVVMVDDQMTFLKSIVTAINAEADCHGFVRPETALEFLNGMSEVPPLFALDQRDVQSEFLISPDDLAGFLASNERFKWVTTVIVDYTMPNMNGLEFCQKIKSPFIRKIMLTGDASLDVAIKAFNDGVIHKFFKKSDDNIIDSLNEAIVSARLEYFSRCSERLQSLSSNKEQLPAWFAQAGVIDYMLSLVREQKAVEFYALNDAGDILLIDAKGKMQLLVMRDQKGMKEMIAQADFAYKTEPDPELLPVLQQIKNQELVLVPLTQEQQFGSLEEWQPLLQPAKAINIDGKDYFYAMVPFESSNLEEYLGVSLQVAPLQDFEGEFLIS